jgi:hypothetical protein
MITEQKCLRPVDLGVALRLEHQPDEHYEDLAAALGLSLSASHRSVRRLQFSGLLLPGARRVNRSALLEVLVSGVRYAFPVSLGAQVRGVPTAGSFASLGSLPQGLDAVWPMAEGEARGPALMPLYEGAPAAALRDERLHRLLALLDVMRVGQPRDRKAGATELRNMLLHP